MRKIATVALVAAAALPLPVGAGAQSNGVGRTPALGWTSWSFFRHHPSAGVVEAEARALRTSGLAAMGYRYVNVDSGWYVCPQTTPPIGPAVDRYGRWIPDPAAFPSGRNNENGIKVVAHYVHHLRLKFGLYVTP